MVTSFSIYIWVHVIFLFSFCLCLLDTNIQLLSLSYVNPRKSLFVAFFCDRKTLGKGPTVKNYIKNIYKVMYKLQSEKKKISGSDVSRV